MYKIIQRFCNNEQDNGLLLLDMPTGSGKTFAVLNYIFDAIQNTEDKRKYFFITTLKKNLPIDELKERFKKADLLELYKEKFLFVDSNSESAINGLTPEVIKTIPLEIKKTDEYKKFESFIKSIQHLRKQKSGSDFKSILIAAEDKIRTDVEPKFRKSIQNLLAKKYTKIQDRLYAIKTDQAWQWVAQLYPAVFMKEKQVIFMSVDKFLSQNSTIVEPSCMLYNSDIINSAVIFIDEFDSSKETMLKSIIQNGLRERIDYIELFNNIYSSLHTHSFPSLLTTSSSARQEGLYKNQSLQSVIDGIKEKAVDIYRLYALQFSHKTESITDESANNFLFQDHQYHSILNGNKSYISAFSDHDKRINSIRFTDNKPNNETSNIQVMLGKLRGFISYFLGGVNILAINYRQCKMERRQPNEDEFTQESAIRTVLAEFGLDNVYINYLTAQILITSHKVKGNIEGSEFDLSFYEKGFRYYAFEDDYTHDTQSKIMMYSFQMTPEKLLLRFCEKAKVLGISATATVPTAIGNYDIDYLKQKLQNKFSTITEDEHCRLNEEFRQSVSGYDQVNINVKLIGDVAYDKNIWRQVIDDDDSAKIFYDIVERNLSDEDNTYNKERYFRIAVAFKEFLVKTEINSFLCVLTKHPRNGDKYLDKTVIDEIFRIIAQYYSSGFNIKTQVVQLDGEEYDNKKDDIIKRLGNGEKLFVLSVYQTIGAGQNLQYPISSLLREELVKTNDRDKNSYKDFDAIYLDKPTNLIVQLGQNLSDEDFVKYLFQVEMLQEVSEISAKNTMIMVKRAFRSFITKAPIQNGEYASNLYKCRSVVLLSTRMIIQAIGRICRTNMKSKNIYIFADSRIVDFIDSDIATGRNFNREFTELLNCIISSQSIPTEESSLEDAASLKSVRVNRFINSLMPNKGMDEDWAEDKIERWKQLRELVLAFPTLPKVEVNKNFIAYNFYAQLPATGNKLYYAEEKNFNNITVGFNKTQQTERCVSAESAKLTELMKIDFLRKHFEKHGWATDFEPNEFIMTPPLFNNIYRGALGEVVGKALYYMYANILLEEITDNKLFEFFDFKFPKASVYVDFKNWHDSSVFDDETMTKHIIAKAQMCNAKCIIIANIIEKSHYQIRKKKIKDIELLILPSLLLQDNSNAPNPDAWDEIRRCNSEYAD